MIHAPRFVQRREHVARDHLVAHEAQVAEQLMVVRLAVRQPLLLVVAMAQEGLLALGTHEVLDVPVFSERGDDALLDRPVARAANRDAHFIVTSQTIQLAFHFACIRIQFDAAAVAVEVVRMVRFAFELERRALVDDRVALEADILANCGRLLACVAFVAQCTSLMNN